MTYCKVQLSTTLNNPYPSAQLPPLYPYAIAHFLNDEERLHNSAVAANKHLLSAIIWARVPNLDNSAEQLHTDNPPVSYNKHIPSKMHEYGREYSPEE